MIKRQASPRNAAAQADANCTTKLSQAIPDLWVTSFSGDEYDTVPEAGSALTPLDQLEAMFRLLGAHNAGATKGSRGYWLALQLRPADDESLERADAKLNAIDRRRAKRYGHRSYEHVELISAAVVDYDEHPEEHPDWRAETWPGAVLFYSSHRWAPEFDAETGFGPCRFRVVIPFAEPMPLEEYKARRAALQALLPRGAKLRAPHQPAFWPTCPLGREVIVGRIDGLALDWTTLPRVERTQGAAVAPIDGADVPDISAIPDVPGSHADITYNVGAWLGSCGYPDAAIKSAVVEHLPWGDDGDAVRQALNGAKAGREGKTTGWKKLGDLIGEDARAALEAAVPNVAREREDDWQQQLPMVRGANDAGAAALAKAVSDVAGAREQGHDPAVDNLICHLAAPAVGVYQRAGQLVMVVREAVTDGECVRPDGTPMIRTLTQPRLKEIVRMAVGPTYERLVGDVMARGEWHDIRPLDAIVTYPVLRRDGSLLLESGYDAATHTLAEIDVHVSVPDAPSRDEATAALGKLLHILRDFPFPSPAHRSAWLAMLLTVPARPAIKGPTPLGLLEASNRGSGKTLLADVLSIIVTGSEAPRRVAAKTKEEWDKSMLALLSAGDPLVLIDNITTMLVSDALDAVLTGTRYTQRVLGVSETRTVEIRTVFLASSNNARVSTDLVRRTIVCRLEPDTENPEQRRGWTITEPLEDYVRRHRAELLGAALTILRAYAVAGRPAVEARTMGSYGAWSRIVRDALVWLGEADPAATQDELRETADVERDEIGEMLSAWHALLSERAVTVRELVDAASMSDGTPRPNALHDALAALMPNGAEPTAHAVGNRLRSLRGQIVGGLVLRESRDSHAKVRRWRVIAAK